MAHSIRAPEPKQARSRKTRERILAATEALLQRRLFEEISVQQIATRSRVSIGSFYNLYGTKDALLPDLYGRHCGALLRDLQELLDPARWRGQSLPKIVRALVRAIVDLHLERRGLLRALVLRSHCDLRRASVARDPAMDRVIPGLARLISSRRDEIAHPNPRRAAEVGFVMVLAMVREHVLYPGTTAHVLRLSSASLVTEMTRAFLGYLNFSESK